MKSFDLKKIATTTALGLVAILGTSELASAQGYRHDQRQERKIDKQQDKIRKQRAKIEQDRLRLQQQRIIAERQRQAQMNRGYGNGNYGNVVAGSRYRVNRNGTYYNTDQRGAQLLQHAVNAGYQQGFQAGRNDRSYNRRIGYSNSNVYQSGTYGYQSHVSQSQYQYYFRQGFQRGYQDGSNTRYQNNYNGQYEYGYNNNGSMSILGTILSQILNIQTY